LRPYFGLIGLLKLSNFKDLLSKSDFDFVEIIANSLIKSSFELNIDPNHEIQKYFNLLSCQIFALNDADYARMVLSWIQMFLSKISIGKRTF
jgi:hypothetical protein